MGVCNSPDVFQGKISTIFKGLYMICSYIDDILVINKNDSKDFLKD